MAESGKEQIETAAREDKETTCWGCGSRLHLPTNGAVFKCGWCGAITNHKANKLETQCLGWRRLRDRCFVSILSTFILFVICAGIWAALPVIFSVCYTSGIVHSVITTILAVTTVSTFGLAAFRCAGAPPMVVWGSYTVVGKGELKNYTFCRYCCKPKSPRAHHCRSCGMCILDMDHHCPFIGNCVGAANHRHFIAFLISAILSSIYASMISAYASFHIWPPLPLPLPLGSKTLHHLALFTTRPSTVAIREATLALIRSAMELPPRGLVLVYLFFASISVEISLIVLLWQQLCYIYDGRTHLSHLSYREGDPVTERDCQNLVRFFGCRCSILRFLPTLRNSRKRHKK